MKFNVIFLSFSSIILSVTGIPIPPNNNTKIKRASIDSSLIPQFGVQSGVNPTGTGDCDGIKGPNGQVVKIPCSCPPDRNTFIQVRFLKNTTKKKEMFSWVFIIYFFKALNANVNAGHAINNPSVTVSFPTGNSKDDNLARINAALVTLQNLNGTGVGCPAASTTFLAQQKAIQNGGTPPAAPSAPVPESTTSPAPAPQQSASSSSAGGSNTGVVDPALVPDLGVQAGQNPTGTGDCDGINNAAGQPIKIPCSCPPDRNTFIQVQYIVSFFPPPLAR